MTTPGETGQPRLDTYQAYLIRIWQDGQGAAWRASAQAVQGGDTVRFANLEALFVFLKAQTTKKTDKETD